jgi:hypothetical protein
VNTHLPIFALSSTTLLGAGLAEFFASAFRALADGVGLVRTVADDFDFAAIFLGLATALAMTEDNPQGDEAMAPYTILSGRAQAAKTR